MISQHRMLMLDTMLSAPRAPALHSVGRSERGDACAFYSLRSRLGSLRCVHAPLRPVSDAKLSSSAAFDMARDQPCLRMCHTVANMMSHKLQSPSGTPVGGGRDEFGGCDGTSTRMSYTRPNNSTNRNVR